MICARGPAEVRSCSSERSRSDSYAVTFGPQKDLGILIENHQSVRLAERDSGGPFDPVHVDIERIRRAAGQVLCRRRLRGGPGPCLICAGVPGAWALVGLPRDDEQGRPGPRRVLGDAGRRRSSDAEEQSNSRGHYRQQAFHLSPFGSELPNLDLRRRSTAATSTVQPAP
jgi:hypothetical protein